MVRRENSLINLIKKQLLYVLVNTSILPKLVVIAQRGGNLLKLGWLGSILLGTG